MDVDNNFKKCISPFTGYDFEHSGHLKGRSPVCFSMWSFSLDWLVNEDGHRSQEAKDFFLKIESSSSRSSTSVIRSPSSADGTLSFSNIISSVL